MEKVTVDSLSVKYSYGALALSDLSFVAERGITCVLGGEESGKTTLLKTIAGLQKSTVGRVFFDGRDVTNSSPKDRNVCLLYEDGRFFEKKSAKENLIYVLKVQNVPKEEWDRRVQVATEKVGLASSFLEQKVKNLSKKDRILLAYARAFLRKADVYLVDDAIRTIENRGEVFGRILPFLEELSEDSVVLYATDSPDECVELGSKVVFLNYGVCLRQGTMEEIKKDPEDIVTVELFYPDAEKCETTIEYTEELFVSAFGEKFSLEKSKLLSEIFIGKNVIAVRIGDRVELFDAKSERKIYFY